MPSAEIQGPILTELADSPLLSLSLSLYLSPSPSVSLRLSMPSCSPCVPPFLCPLSLYLLYIALETPLLSSRRNTSKACQMPTQQPPCAGYCIKQDIKPVQTLKAIRPTGQLKLGALICPISFLLRQGILHQGNGATDLLAKLFEGV